MKKKQFEVVVTSYGLNKHLDEINKKKQEKANNSLSYRFAAIKKRIILFKQVVLKTKFC